LASFDTLLEKDKGRSKPAKSANSVEGQPKLKIFESPLAHERRGSALIPSPKESAVINISGPTDLAVKNIDRASYLPKTYDGRNYDPQEPNKERIDDANLRDTPEFKRYEEATNIELFYDLFSSRT
jgi:hypothetical protein